LHIALPSGSVTPRRTWLLLPINRQLALQTVALHLAGDLIETLLDGLEVTAFPWAEDGRTRTLGTQVLNELSLRPCD
jgi:hypothetical protein